MKQPLTLHFTLRKLHSLTGIFPVGFFLLEHIFTNSFALRGAEEYNSKIEFFQSMPYLLAIEMGFIIIPLLYHGAYGLVVTWGMGANVVGYPRVRNWMYFLQRATGVVTIVYVLYHVYTLRVAALLFGAEVSFDRMARVLESCPVFAFYVAGLLAACFHFTNGVWSFCISWGITAGHWSQRTLAWVCAALGAVLFAAGLNSLLAFTGSALVF